MGTAPQTAPERKSRRRFVAAVVAMALLFVGTISSVLYLTSDSFRSYVRGRVVSQLEEMTGGRVELGRLDWNLSKLQVEAQDLTIHGLEAPGDTPYVHIGRMRLQLKIFSLLEQDLGIRDLLLDRPVVHLIVYPDGRTNQPVPRKARTLPRPNLQQLFHVELDRTELRDGLLIVNEQRIELNGNAQNVMAEMFYAARTDEYKGRVKVGSVAVRYGNYLPTQLSTDFEFALRHDQLEVKSAKLSTPKSSVTLSGSVNKFSSPVVEVRFEGSGDLAELGTISRNSELRKGFVGISGSVQYSAGNYTSSGKIILRAFQYQDPQLSLENVDATADYNLNPKRLMLRNLVTHAFGGSLRGEGTVDNWLASPQIQPSGEKAPLRPQVGSAQFRLDGISLAQFMKAVSTRTLPLDRLNAAGAIYGTMNLHWRATLSSATVGFDTTISPPATVAPGVLAVSGEAHGSYEVARNRIMLTQARVDAPGLQATAAGPIGIRNQQMAVSISVQDLSRVQPILSALGQHVPWLSGIAGGGTFRGNISGTLNAPSVSGHVELRAASLPVSAIKPQSAPTLPGANMQPAERLEFDAISGDVSLSPDNLVIHNGTARHKQTNVEFDFSAGLSNGALLPNSRISGRINLENEDAAELERVVGYSYPVQGKVAANLQIAGTEAMPQASCHVQVSDPVFGAEAAKLLTADITLSPDRVSASRFTIIQNGGRISGTGYYEVDSTAFQFRADGQNLDISKIHYLQRPNMRIAGKFNFVADGSGNTREPVINADVHATKLALNDQSIGDLNLSADTKGEVLQLTAHSDFERALVNLDGTVRLRRDFPAQVKLTFSEFNLAPFIPSRAATTTRMAGTLMASGPLRDPKQFMATLELSQLAATMHRINLTNSGPVRMGINAQELRIESLKLQGEDTELSAAGTVSLTGRKQVRVAASGHVNLRIAQTLDPDLVTSGSMTLNVDIAGTVARPRVLGQVTVANGAIALIDLPNGLSNINGTLIFDQDQLSVQSMTARTGGGSIQVGGYIAYRNELSFNLTALGNDVRLRYPQGVSSTADMTLRLAGTLKNSTLSGDITVTRFGITPQFDLALYLARSKMAPQAPNPDSPTYNLHLDMHVVSTPELQVQTTVGKLAGDVDLRVRGTAAKPVVLGRINITEGQIAFNGTDYELRRGDITFTNPVGIVPVLNVEAATRIRNYDITLTFHGDVNHLATNYRSDPPLPEGDVVSLLAFGRTREETDLSSTSSFGLNGTVSNALLGEALNSAVGDRVQKLFGVSRIKISPDYATTTTNPTAQVTIEQQVSKKITVTYITSLTQTTYSQQAIQVEYNINRDVSVIGGRDLYGIVSFDVKIRQRRK
ncbi:MAG TPA: translocation/assembly module TamB domain-containing protein [Terriglobales bacterium]|nr:translocation/assembly module TamB domain-containing protein [Terriglobales bacterium]